MTPQIYHTIMHRLQYVPMDFKIRHPFQYPEDNHTEFERWFFESLKRDEITGRTYLPVFWTAYHCAHGYGGKQAQRNKLQLFVDSLPRSEKYFTICQYDDGPLVDFKDLDIIVCGMSGGRIDYPLPLLCQPHEWKFESSRSLFCSFIGGDTHPIRKKMVADFASKMQCFVTMNKHTLREYCEIMSRSMFALCPRGYGKSSFRIQEAIQYGAVPVYISDEFVVPYNMPLDYCITITAGQNTYEVLMAAAHELPVFRERIAAIANLFTYEGCKQKILAEVANA